MWHKGVQTPNTSQYGAIRWQYEIKKIFFLQNEALSSHKVTQLPLAYRPLCNHLSQLQTDWLDHTSRRFHHKILMHNILADTDCEVELIFTAICKSVNEKQLETTNAVLGNADYYTLTKLYLYLSRSFQSEGLATWFSCYVHQI
jgi:hypothetical protein